ncbi:hypothetical protein GOV07_00865, partial [Candidatus Woesearchaeota archaeon]|nr:hypothetical protein [Candidatus Woesearchaeota archaeon]
MKRLLLLILLTILIVGCANEQIIDEPPLPPVSDVDTVIAPIIDEPAPTFDAKEALCAIYNNPLEEYSVAYTLTKTENGQTQKRSEVLFVKGKKERNDIEIIVDGLSYEERGIGLSDRVIVCAKPLEWECYELPVPQNTTKEKPSCDELWGDKEVQFSPDRLVVGTVTNCFISAVTIPGEGMTTSEACYTDDGIPLYFEIKGSQGTIVQQASSYGTAVPDSAFEPPVKPGTEEEFI